MEFLNIKYYIQLMRPKQWFKSFYLIFGAIPAIVLMKPNIFLISYILLLGITDLILIQGIIYTINDIFDIENDRKHPMKKYRPLASGKITVKKAIVFALFLFLISSVLSLLIDKRVFIINILLITTNILYSIWPRLKDIVFLDIMTVGFNFPLRVAVGWYLLEPYNFYRLKASFEIISKSLSVSGQTIQEIILSTTPKIIDIHFSFSTITLSFISMMLFTYFIAVYLSTLKRLREKIEGHETSRPVLKEYSETSLKFIAITSAFLSFAFSLLLIWTLKLSLILIEPVFLYGIIRYYKMTFEKNSIVGKPEEILFNKEFITIILISFIIGVIAIFFF